MNEITIALTKGDRVLRDQLALLTSIGITPTEDITRSRKLVFETTRDGVRLLVLRSSDVATYVEHGIADLGMSGKDVLLEHGQNGFYQPLDLKIGKCKMMVAGLANEPPLPQRVKVATKFVNTAKRYFAEQGMQVDVIRLYGAMELAPISGLAHRIVDIVETGNTLKANGLVQMDLICEISMRLIVNKVSMKMKHAAIKELIVALDEATVEE
ncbi:MAG: ATP phosphoribosyltransferase [Pseudomonadales bacterium]